MQFCAVAEWVGSSMDRSEHRWIKALLDQIMERLEHASEQLPLVHDCVLKQCAGCTCASHFLGSSKCHATLFRWDSM